MSITYRGRTLPFAKHTEEIPERVRKDIAFPAVDGLEVMHFGERGQPFVVVGRITNIAGIGLKISDINAWSDTSVGTLVIHGTSYTNVELENASFTDFYKDAVTGHIGCTYRLQFRKIQ